MAAQLMATKGSEALGLALWESAYFLARRMVSFSALLLPMMFRNCFFCDVASAVLD